MWPNHVKSWRLPPFPFRAYVTVHRHCVVLRLVGETIVMSPDEPEAFIKALQP